jgi:cysteine dioxygenase
MSPRPIHDLMTDLDRDLLAGAKGAGIVPLLEAYARDHDDWRHYARHAPDRYTRNLVGRSELFELMVICWREEHVSPIHDHDGQRCWMVVLEGTMQETLFDLSTPSASGTEAPLRTRSTRSLEPGQVCYITDDIALHEIRPLHGPGVSLHLYANPIATCRTFDPATGRSRSRVLRYDSIEGELQPAPA